MRINPPNIPLNIRLYLKEYTVNGFRLVTVKTVSGLTKIKNICTKFYNFCILITSINNKQNRTNLGHQVGRPGKQRSKLKLFIIVALFHS